MEEVEIPEIDREGLEEEAKVIFPNEEKRKLYVYILVKSVEEAKALTNLVSLMVEYPEIVTNADSRRKMHEALEAHREKMGELEKKVKKL